MDNNIKIKLHVVVGKRTKYWVAYCPSIRTYGYSDKSKEAALKDFDDALKTFLHVHTTLGTLNKTLFNFGWVRKEKKIEAPHINMGKNRFKSATETTRQVDIPAFC
jgi:hypothetical protein